MNAPIKSALAAFLLLALSCKKENIGIQTSRVTGKSSTSDIITFNNDQGKYPSVQIGTQKWMIKNLDVTHYRNGDSIPQVKNKAAWNHLTTGAWCWYKNDSANGAVYGKLYNWYAVNDPRGLAPAGWHIPTDTEWDILSTFLGSNAGGKLKDTGTIEAGTGLWYAPNTGANNQKGFTGLPGSFRNYNGIFGETFDIGYVGYWWSSTETGHSANRAWYRYLYYISGDVGNSNFSKLCGFSVRCVKD